MTMLSLLKQCSLVTILLCFIFSIGSLWHTQQLHVAPELIEEQASEETDSIDLSKFLSDPNYNPTEAYLELFYNNAKLDISPPSPISLHASGTPTPFTKYITESLYGTRKRTSQAKYIDTTINTPVRVTIADITGNIIDSNITDMRVTCSTNATVQISKDLKYLIYTPQHWFIGLDKLTFGFNHTLSGSSNHSEIITWIRIRTGVVLNKPLIQTPPKYKFSETPLGTSDWLKEVLKQIDASVFPDHDTWLNRRYNTCAVVGNGGSLRGRKRGAEIDSHDVVVRINLSPIEGYEEDVGSKISLGISNGPSSSSCWKRGNESECSGMEILAQATWPEQFRRWQFCQNTYTQVNYIPMSYLFVDLADEILNEYNRVLFGGTLKKYRSTGMLAVTAMTMICDHVSVYGFERGPNMENNYFNSTYDREWSGHSYQAEKEYYRDLAKGTGLFEPFLELYDLYTSISYIVD